MIAEYLPVFRLRLRTERLELRLPDFDDLEQLAAAAADGIHDPDFMPFLVPWTAVPPRERARGTVLWMMRTIGNLSAEAWQLPFVTVFEGRVVGMQEIYGKEFKLKREVESGSWLTMAQHGKGIGTEMRAAVLALAFSGLGADYATSASFDGNAASAGVSRKLGYQGDGFEFHVVRGERRLDWRWRLSRADWESHRRHEVTIEGLDDEVLAMLGLGSEADKGDKDDQEEQA
jgi:RimJ/RimL family protein N-acetyltransferase